jgi:putative NADH-flavin reductase
MKLAIIGASAGVGLEAVKLALQKGHKVVTLSRSTDGIGDNPNLTKIMGSATIAGNVQKAIKGADAMIVTIGTNITRETTVFSDAAKAIVQALRENGRAIPLIVLTGFGAGDTEKYLPFPFTLFYRLLLKGIYADKNKMENIITSAYQNWVMVRPGRLTNGAATGHYKVLDKVDEKVKISSMSRADIAGLMIAQAENPTMRGKYVYPTH